MKLDEEMRARARAVLAEFDPAWAATMSNCDEQLLLAGYRMGLERAAKACSEIEDKWSENGRGHLNEYEQGRVNSAIECAAAIREMAHD